MMSDKYESREYTIILSNLVKDEMLDAEEVLLHLLKWMSEDDVYMFCQDEYDVVTNAAYKAKYDALDALNEEEKDDD